METPTHSLGIMTFSVATGATIHFGGSSQTTPTTQVSIDNILAGGIPQTLLKDRFLTPQDDEVLGHNIRHANIRIGKPGTTGSGSWVWRAHGVTFDATNGFPHAYGEDINVVNGRSEIFNMGLLNATGGTVVFYVEVLE